MGIIINNSQSETQKRNFGELNLARGWTASRNISNTESALQMKGKVLSTGTEINKLKERLNDWQKHGIRFFSIYTNELGAQQVNKLIFCQLIFCLR